MSWKARLARVANGFLQPLDVELVRPSSRSNTTAIPNQRVGVDAAFSNTGAPRCWGIGLGRTGTNSLCKALRLLGYRNVLHNPTFESLATADGGADNGVIIFYKYLDYKFPGSKFVLTLRDRESWLESMEYTSDVFPVASADQDLPIMRRMLLYEAVKFDRAVFTAAYERHHQDVRRYFRSRPDDLLEMNIFSGDGWEKLCAFLGLPVPREPFPHLHPRGRETMKEGLWA